MAKINDTTTYPNTTPALTDHVPGTDVSNTANDANGETVTFTIDAILALLRTELASTANGDGASLVSIEDAAGNFTGTDVEAALTELFASYDNLSQFEGFSPGNFLTDSDLTIYAFNAGGSASATRPSGYDVVVWYNHGDAVPTNAGTNDIYTLPTGTRNYSAKTAAYTITDDDMGSTINVTSGTVTITIDTNANQAITLVSGKLREISFVNTSGNDLTIDAATGVTIDGTSGGSVTVADGKGLWVAKIATDTWITVGT